MDLIENIKLLSEILKSIKLDKEDEIYFYGNMTICGTTYIKIINANPFFNLINPNITVGFRGEELKEFIKNCDTSVQFFIDTMDNCVVLSYGNTTIKSIKKLGTYFQSLYNAYNNIGRCISKSPLYTDSNLKDNEKFMELIERKSHDGVGLLKIDRFILTIFSSLLNINKADKVSLSIYHIDAYSFLCKFDIDKKKFILSYYIRFSYLV